jgi:hypothetical protein
VPVSITCACGKKLTVGDALIGKRVRCPQCQQVLSVPEEKSASPETPNSGQKTVSDAAAEKRRSAAAGTGGKRKSKLLWFAVIGGGLLLSCCCLAGLGGGVLFMLVPREKELAGNFPIEEKGTWTSSDRKTNIPQKSNIRAAFRGYVVPLKANKTYAISLNREGGDTDPFLMVENLDGLIAAFDGDHGGSASAKVVYTPTKDGNYHIRAATLKGTGDFTLTIRELTSGQSLAPGGQYNFLLCSQFTCRH